ncbi:single-stranded DNA-binding protein [Nocardia otitidiscaviarum]|uniref:Single-stranded DNA-binding protein n=1 Tax=Nocardia otitidiscaviarum TaxID=1823 RepID=A0A516NIZ7_9NOCA|nr:single-stranded DNA-binding protein [Nocardia otitidiscaviarum]MCP9619673.1 single-stranded DNA-binding protein [Nocardia otitidiscaviarum]QDP78884.1 single-stranded DNA-binding protein [Nocardia otitidiscaviarum]
MPSTVSVTITGHLADEPSSRATPTGKLVTNFVVIANDRRFDRDQNQWVDANKTVVRVACWGDLAETTAASLDKGCRVTVTGHRLIADPYIGQDSKPHAALQLTADTVAVDLKGQATKIERLRRSPASPIDANEPPF